MAIDVETLAAARTYTDDSLKGVGSVQGKNCTIQEITKEGTTNTVVFGWTDDEGNVSTSEMIVEDGKDGVDGKDGEVGPKGDSGEKGETGETGATGASAYEVALANGFEGSEEDWLKSLTPTNIVTVSNSPFESHAGNFKVNEIGGKSEQFSTTGAQLYDASKVMESYTTVDDDEWITAEYDNTNGTSVTYLIPTPPASDLIQTNRDYTLVVEIKENTADLLQICSADTSNYIGQFVTDSFLNLKPGIYAKIITARSDFSDCSTMLRTIVGVNAGNKGKAVFRISVLEDTTITADTFVYEPYTGGMPAPNPDYPQEIKKTVVSEIKTHGKNFARSMLPYVATQWGVALYVDCDLQPSTQYTISFDGASGNTYYFNEYLFNGPEYVYVTNGRTTATFTTKDELPKNASTYSETGAGWIFFKNSRDQLSDNVFTDLQLEKGSVATDYEPYTESTIKLSTPVELYGIGDVQDTIDVENGKVIRYYGVATENNLFLASGGSVSAGGLSWFDCNTNSVEGGNGCCTHLMKLGYAWSATAPCCTVSGGHIRIYDTANTNEEFKAKYAGLEFIYQHSEPVIEDLPIADQSALNALKTYNNLTYVDFDSEVKPTFSGETALTEEGSHILESLAKSNALTLEYLDAATYICDNLP